VTVMEVEEMGVDSLSGPVISLTKGLRSNSCSGWVHCP
jgi:hypothetical protein